MEKPSTYKPMNVLKTMVFLKNFMGMGIGKQYWVESILYFVGKLEECIEFMNRNKPENEFEWYELNPIVNVKQKKCNEYQCILVKMDDHCK